MPELPEVETLRRSLEPALLGQPVTRVTIHRRDIISAPGDPPGGFSRSRSTQPPVHITDSDLLASASIAALTRHGKQLGIETDRGRALIVHLGMTGGVRVLEPGDEQPPHTHVVWTLADGRRAAFVDPRRFGLVRIAPKGTHAIWAALGPDALTVRAPALHARLQRTARVIKAALLDQQVLAGVGNIYADESLFKSRIHPMTPANAIGAEETRLLAAAIRSILRRAIGKGGSSIRDYRDSSGTPGGYQNAHAVYGRAGEPCRACKRPLMGTTIAQRTTVHCAACQPLCTTARPGPQSGG